MKLSNPWDQKFKMNKGKLIGNTLRTWFSTYQCPTLINHNNSSRNFLKRCPHIIKPRKLRILPFLHLGKMVSWRVTQTPSPTSLINSFTKEFTPVTDIPILDKGPSPHSQMEDINVQVSGVEKLLGNINPHKAKGPDEIHGRVLKECKTK